LAEPVRVLFVCLGNICRSPLAEALARREAGRRGLTGRFIFASAGTGDWNLGLPPDPGIMRLAHYHGLPMQHHRARQISADDIPDWDWFVVMDARNRADLLALGVAEGKILPMGRFVAGPEDIPDPYGGDDAAFARVYTLLEQGAAPLLDFLLSWMLSCPSAPP